MPVRLWEMRYSAVDAESALSKYEYQPILELSSSRLKQE